MNSEWEENYKRLEPVLDRMVQSGWMTGYVKTGDSIAYDWTDKGLGRLKQFCEILTELDPTTFLSTESALFWAFIIAQGSGHGFFNPPNGGINFFR